MKTRLLLVALFAVLPTLRGAGLPNILWITSEDNAAHWLGCYGNEQAKTPRIDALAARGVLFTNAYANAPVCAVARSTILTGVHAPSQGTQHMRSRHAIPPSYKPYVSYLRDLGYYCTNNSKTDYNIKGNDKAIWDECSRTAHYKNRPDGKPFFAIFNFTTSHESSLFRARGATRLDPSEVNVPPCLPGLPEVRSDFAKYHDILTRLDAQIGKALDDLGKAGLAGDTIVFYYSDHGGPTPRGKRYLEDTGTRVPMIVHVPEKWEHLTPFKQGRKVTEPVAFVDLAPTLLSLAGLEKPGHMQGRAFLGKHRAEPSPGGFVFLYGDRFDEASYGMRRAITDGRWKYHRRFTPHLPAAPYSSYQFSMPSWVAMRKAWREGKLTGYHKALWETPQPVEELYDTRNDPWEVNNLAGDPSHAGRLRDMRAALKGVMTKVCDTGIIPEPMFDELAGSGTIAGFAQSAKFDHGGALDLAFLASARKASNLPALRKAMKSEDPVKRYWGLLGCAILGKPAAEAAPALETAASNDPRFVNRVAAAQALHALGRQQEALELILAGLENGGNSYAVQYALNALNNMDGLDKVPRSWATRIRNDKSAPLYLKRLAQQILKEHSE